MKYFYKSTAIFLCIFQAFMHPLALLATTVAIDGGGLIASGPALVMRVPNDFIFSKDLYNGIQDNEVMMLQILLNAQNETRISESGTGSTGYETSYFGNLTQNAVERFQNKYKTVILDPIGVTNPTGIVGGRTRSVLNQVLANLKANRSPDANITIGSATFSTTTATSTSSTTATTTTATGSVYPTVITTSVPDATVGRAYFAVLQSTGGEVDNTWDVLPGSLPNGITATSTVSSCSSSPCHPPLYISGTPTVAGSFNFVVRIHSGDYYSTKDLTLHVQSGVQNTTGNTNAQTTTSTNNYTSGTSNTSSTNTSSSSSSSSNIGVALGILGGAVAVSAISSAVSSGASTAVSSGASSASGGGMRTVFGGRLGYVQYCTCSTSILLFVYDVDLKTVIQLVYIPGISTLKADYNIFQGSGQQVLGGFTPGGVCMVYAGTSCVNFGTPIGTIDTIRGIGSSLQ